MPSLASFVLVILFSLFQSLSSAQNWSNHYSSALTASQIQEKQDNYHSGLKKLEIYRQNQFRLYQQASSAEKSRIIEGSLQELERYLVEEIFPAWSGTPWDFNGISQTPGEGEIACGYFVSTCLTHLGYRVNRIKLAQQPSQRIIETFMPKSERKILYGSVPMAKVRDHLKKSGSGIYLVGLDRHVGFIAVAGDDMAFVHSSYYLPKKVAKSEPIDAKNPLSDSKYRVIGKLFSDDMVIGWLSNRQYVVSR